MKKLILASLILVSSQMAMAANWVYVGENANSHVYIDKDSLTVNQFPNGQKYITTWSRVDHKSLQKIEPNLIYSQHQAFEYYDCINKKWSHDFVTAYDTMGRVVIRDNIQKTNLHSSNNWERLPPASIGHSALILACSAFGL